MSALGSLANAVVPMVADTIMRESVSPPVAKDQIDLQFENALIRREDPRFWEDPAIDWGLIVAAAIGGFAVGMMLTRK